MMEIVIIFMEFLLNYSYDIIIYNYLFVNLMQELLISYHQVIFLFIHLLYNVLIYYFYVFTINYIFIFINQINLSKVNHLYIFEALLIVVVFRIVFKCRIVLSNIIF